MKEVLFTKESFKANLPIVLFMKTKFVIISTVVLSWLYPNQFLLATSSDKKLSIQLANAYLKSFPREVIKKKKEQVTKDKKTTPDYKLKEVKLSDTDKKTVVFNTIFASSNLYDLQERQMMPILNEYAWNDLHLFCGSTNTPGYHLMSRINRTITSLGESALATFLATPTTNIEEIQQRQDIIKLLIKQPTLHSQLTEEIKRYHAVEQRLLSFWTETDPLYTKEYNVYMNKRFYTNNVKLHTSSSSLQWRKIFFRDMWDIYLNFVFYPFLSCLVNEPYLWFTGLQNRKEFYRDAFPMFVPIWNFFHVKNNFNVKVSGSQVFYIMPTIITLHTAWQWYKGIANYKEFSSVLRNLALRVIDVQTFIHTVGAINMIIKETPVLEKIYSPHLNAIRKLINLEHENTELGILIKNLKNMPLTKWSYFFNNAGTLLASHKLFVANRQLFHDALYELGKLDVFVSITTLVQEINKKQLPHAYTFTKFLTKSEKNKPYIKVIKMWNPFLDPEQAVDNSIEMDGGGDTRNIILTGPNAGGKSTFLTGITDTLLLSQTFGIAPAQEVVITPFSKLNTYIDVSDDIAAGKSLFMAEVDRFQKHFNILKSLTQDEFSFTIIDEPFSGTNPIEGAAASYSVLDYMAKYTNTLTIVATHYPILTGLEKKSQKKGFRNYKVYINHRGRGEKINYTYKIIPGASHQTIALDILEEQGCAPEMLEQARNIIAHPEKYHKKY